MALSSRRFYFFLGILLFLDRGLLALSNIYLLLGVTILLGLRGSLSFYFAPAHLVQSTCFFAGIYMVLKGYAFPGFSLESIGFFLLFRRKIPEAREVLYSIPYVGFLLSYVIPRMRS